MDSQPIKSKCLHTKLRTDQKMQARHSPIQTCSTESRSHQTVASDLVGTLLMSRNSFPYFFLIALEAGSILRALLLLILTPLIFITHALISEPLAIKLQIFISFSALNLHDIEIVSRSVLPRFYADDVNPQAWRVFSSFGKRLIVTEYPRIMVEPFAKNFLGADKVLGTELEVTSNGKATGFVSKPGSILAGERKRRALEAEMGDEVVHVGIGDRRSNFHFMSICKVNNSIP